MLINESNGYLLSESCSVDEIIGKLKNLEFYKEHRVREEAYRIFLEKYNAQKNYLNFIDRLSKL